MSEPNNRDPDLERDPEPETNVEKKPRLLARGLGLVLIAIAVVSLVYVLVAYLAWRSGQNLATETQAQQLAEQIDRQLVLAEEDYKAGNEDLAQRRLDWVIDTDPNDKAALALIEQWEHDRLSAESLAATLQAPTPTPITEATPMADITDDAQSGLLQLRLLSDSEDWGDAIETIRLFQREYPQYERQQTDEMLYKALIAHGEELLYGDQVELGLYYLEQAEQLGDLPQSTLDQQLWAELYLQGIAYFGVNWSLATIFFRDLCLAAPFYQDSCELFYESLVGYGDQHAFGQDWCPAVDLYREAYRLDRTSQLADKLNSANENCLLATPTPTEPISDTLSTENN